MKPGITSPAVSIFMLLTSPRFGSKCREGALLEKVPAIVPLFDRSGSDIYSDKHSQAVLSREGNWRMAAQRQATGFAEGWRANVPEAAISHAVDHPIRLDCLAILIEREASAKEIAAVLGIDTPSADHHFQELYVDGVIERKKTKRGGPRRGGSEHFYRAKVRPEVSDEELAKMPREARRAMAGCVARAIIALTLSSLRHGAMDDDNNLHLAWNVVSVDAEGDDELAKAEADFLENVEAIRERNAARAAEGAKLTTRIVASQGFKRGEPGNLVELSRKKEVEG